MQQFNAAKISPSAGIRPQEARIFIIVRVNSQEIPLQSKNSEIAFASEDKVGIKINPVLRRASKQEAE